MSLLVIRDFVGELCHKVRSFRTGTDKVHVTPQDIPELRDFIDADLANDAPHARHALVISLGPNRSIFLGVCAHRAKLHELEWAAVLPDALLLVKNGSARIQLDQNRGGDGNWDRKNRT